MALPVFTSCSSDDEPKAGANKNLLEIEVLENAQTRTTSPLYNSIPSKTYYGIYLADNDGNVATNCNNVSVYYYEGNSTVAMTERSMHTIHTTVPSIRLTLISKA